MCSVVASPASLTTSKESNLSDDSAELATPTVDFGIDFEAVIKRCIEERIGHGTYHFAGHEHVPFEEETFPADQASGAEKREEQPSRESEDTVNVNNYSGDDDWVILDIHGQETSSQPEGDMEVIGEEEDLIGDTLKDTSSTATYIAPVAESTSAFESSDLVIINIDEFPQLSRALTCGVAGSGNKPSDRPSETDIKKPKVRLKKKWKYVESEFVSFDYFPKRPVVSIEEDQEIIAALEKFHNDLTSCSTVKECTATENECHKECMTSCNTVKECIATENDCHQECMTSCNTVKECIATEDDIHQECMGTCDGAASELQTNPSKNDEKDNTHSAEGKTTKIPNKRERKKRKRITNAFTDYENDTDLTWEDLVPAKMANHIAKYVYNKVDRGQCLRNKHKWRTQKARLQIKHKSCRSVKNNPHGRKLYADHRLVTYFFNLYGNQYEFLPKRRTLKDIDRKVPDRVQTCLLKSGAATIRHQSRNNHHQSGNNHHDRDYPRAVPFAINRQNVDRDLDRDLANLLIAMQDRDLTPEDYEMLLRLDDRVEPKTVDSSVIETFVVDTAGDADVEEVCSVCMESYLVGQERKYLPCGHYFHTQCIEYWLNNSSMNCPLDGLSVTPS